jgi:hypothetical protein
MMPRFKRPFSARSALLGAIALLAGAGLSATLFITSPAEAFPHVVQPGDTLAAIAERYYGRIQLERVLSTANHLDGTGAGGLTPGMLLDVPAVTYRQVHQDETWKSLAQELLGSEKRYIHLAQINGHKPWIEPELGQLIMIPYNLRWLATGEESLATLAYRYLGSTKHAFQIVQYNDLGEDGPERGDVLLLPLHELPLTDEGKAAAEAAAAQITEQSRGDHFRRQQDSREESKQLLEDVRGGRYVSAVHMGTRLLSAGKLTHEGRAQVHLLLLEAYVALDARGLARTACEGWRSLEPKGELDPLTTSPKILRVCPKAPEPVSEKEETPGNQEAKDDE